jgi:hypothetical protein
MDLKAMTFGRGNSQASDYAIALTALTARVWLACAQTRTCDFGSDRSFHYLSPGTAIARRLAP